MLEMGTYGSVGEPTGMVQRLYPANLHVRFDEGGGGPAWPHSYSTV